LEHVATDLLSSIVVAGTVVSADGRTSVGPRKSSELDRIRWVNAFIAN
jgi:hypothetical protein